jgi:3-oxoacyl-[acyl-carrier-protein] synthase II
MRRVVITGLGMITPLGCGVEPTWSRLIAGESGASRIQHFDVSDLPCQVACIVPRGDGSDGSYRPDDWMEPKEQRKVDEFIRLRCRRRPAGPGRCRLAGRRRYEEQTRTGVLIGSGIGGLIGHRRHVDHFCATAGRAAFRRSSSPAG